jgi:L-galactose dehydrogenase/L-glyceraldehyde 3-phosphate reductase
VKQRSLGNTGLKVSEIGFGAGIAAGMFVSGTHEVQVEAAKRALELGINHFDTAPQYGEGVSETNLGRVLQELKPSIVLSTKLDLFADDMRDLRSSTQRLLEESLRRLGRDSVEIYYLHNRIEKERSDEWGYFPSATPRDILGKGGIADALELVQSRGLTKLVGLTCIGDAALVNQVVDSGRFQVAQLYYNLLNPSAGVPLPPNSRLHNFQLVIDHCAAKGMGVAVFRVLAGGAAVGPEARQGLAGPTNSVSMHGLTYAEEEARAKRLDALVGGEITSRVELALRFALANGKVSTVMVGFSRREHIETAVAAAAKGPLPTPFMERLRELWV